MLPRLTQDPISPRCGILAQTPAAGDCDDTFFFYSAQTSGKTTTILAVVTATGITPGSLIAWKCWTGFFFVFSLGWSHSVDIMKVKKQIVSLEWKHWKLRRDDYSGWVAEVMQLDWWVAIFPVILFLEHLFELCWIDKKNVKFNIQKLAFQVSVPILNKFDTQTWKNKNNFKDSAILCHCKSCNKLLFDGSRLIRPSWIRI